MNKTQQITTKEWEAHYEEALEGMTMEMGKVGKSKLMVDAEECVVSVKDIELDDGRKAQVQIKITTDPFEFIED